MNKSRLSAIDALRGVAALMVVLFHARAKLWVGAGYFWHNPMLKFSPAALLGYLSIPFSYGFLGVQLLFVISGYCIHRNNAKKLAQKTAQAISWPSYFRRRFWRIYPTLIAALFLTWLIDSAPVRFAVPFKEQSDSLQTALANLFALQGLAAPSFGSNLVLWTLALEIHFYLLYPLLFAVRRKLGPYQTLALVFAVSAISAVLVLTLNLKAALPFWHDGNPIFLVYWFTWVSGFFLAEVEFNLAVLPRYLTQLGLVCLVGALALRQLGLQPLDELLFAVAAASLVAAAMRSEKTNFRLPAWLTFLGVFSYSLYITHLPVIYLLKNVIPGMASPHTTLLTACTAVLICTLTGWLFYQLIECWSLRVRPFQTLWITSNDKAAEAKAIALDPAI